MTWTNELFFIFPPFSLLPRILQKVEEEGAEAILIAPLWPTQSWWPSLLRLIVGQSFKMPHPERILYLPHKEGKQHPLKRMSLGCFPDIFSHIRKTLKNKGIPKRARNLILKSWRNSTKIQYITYITKWFAFCKHEIIYPVQPDINDVLNFLSQLHSKGLKYSSLGTARSALSTFLKICSNININEFEEVSRFMKGAFLDRPALPRYTTTMASRHSVELYQVVRKSYSATIIRKN